MQGGLVGGDGGHGQLDAQAVRQPRGAMVEVAGEHGGQEREGREVIDDGRRIGGRGQELQLADRLLAAAQRPRGVGARDAGARAQVAQQALGLAQRMVEEHALLAGGQAGDSRQDLLLGPGPEALHRTDAAGLARLFQVVQAADAQGLVQGQDPLARHPGDEAQLQDPGRQLRAQPLQPLGPPRAV